MKAPLGLGFFGGCFCLAIFSFFYIALIVLYISCKSKSSSYDCKNTDKIHNKLSWTAIPIVIYVTCMKVTFQHLVLPLIFHLRCFGLFWPCEMTWPLAKDVFLSHFRMRTQMETSPTNRAGHRHLDLTRCLGLLPYQGREALYTQYTAPQSPHLVPQAVTRVFPLGPFSLT